MPTKPGRLNYGDTIGILAPASAPPDPKTIDRSVVALERLGFKPKLAPNVRKCSASSPAPTATGPATS